MFRNRKLWSAALVAAGLGVGYFAVSWGDQRATGQERKGGGVPPGRYTVVDTEATNLLVVDNQTNQLYFYTAEKDQPPGADLHLRGSIDLNRVGDATLKVKKGAGEPAPVGR